MITIEEGNRLLKAAIYAKLTLADYRELERAATEQLKKGTPIKLLLDLTQITGFTLDVAWEEIKFTQAHAQDFQRIAIVTPDEWAPWMGWVSAAFSDAEVMLFEDVAAAETWIGG